MGYTDLFHLQGGVERLVNNNEDQVNPWEVTNGAKGYNSVSRHIVYAGGGQGRQDPEGHHTELQEKGTGEVCEGLPSQIPRMCALWDTTSWRPKPAPFSMYRNG